MLSRTCSRFGPAAVRASGHANSWTAAGHPVSSAPTVSNFGQLFKALLLGVVLVPLLGIVPAVMPFFFDNIRPEAPARNPVVRFVLVTVAVGAGAAIAWRAIRTRPIRIRLSDEIEIGYLLGTESIPYFDVDQATLLHRNFTVGGHGDIPMTVEETVFTLSFRDGSQAKLSLVPSKERPFLDLLERRLSEVQRASSPGEPAIKVVPSWLDDDGSGE